jgi:hypothetical protein
MSHVALHAGKRTNGCMSNQNSGESLPTPSLSGGAIDATNPKDQALIRNAIKEWPKRWRGLTDSFKERCVRDMEWAAEQARLAPDPLEGAKVLTSIAKTVVAMEGQQQADDHLADKNSRLDSGLATERISVAPVITLRGLPDDDAG